MPNWSQHSFENGITDDPIDAGDGYCHRAENLLLDSNRKLVQRPWLKPFIDQETGSSTNHKIFNFGQLNHSTGGYIVAYKGTENLSSEVASLVYYRMVNGTNSGNPTEATASAINPTMSVGYGTGVSPYLFNFKKMQGFSLVTNRRMMYPRKMWENTDGLTVKVRGAGLPKPAYGTYNTGIKAEVLTPSLVTFGVNLVGGRFDYRYACVLWESYGYNPATVGNWTLKFIRLNGSVVTITSNLKSFSAAMLDLNNQCQTSYPELSISYKIDTAGVPPTVGWVAIVSTVQNGLGMGAKLTSTVASSGTAQYVAVDSGDTVATSQTYKSEMVIKHSYSINANGVTTAIEDISEPYTVFSRLPNYFDSILVTDPGSATFSGVNADYTASDYYTQWYVSKNNLTTTYYNGQVVSGTGLTISYLTSNEATLAKSSTLYTNGGILPNTRVPRCKYAHYVPESATAYYGNYLEESSSATWFKTRILQSKSGDFDSVPADNFIDIGDEVTGISSYRGLPIVFGKNSCNRIEGVFDDSGGGLAASVNYSNTAGCISHDSIVEIESGLLFAGVDGIYFTNGYQARNITPHLRRYYAELVADGVNNFDKPVYAAVALNSGLVWFTFPNNGQSVSLVIDINYGLGPQAVVMGPMTVEVSENGDLKYADYFGQISFFADGTVVIPRQRPVTFYQLSDINQDVTSSWTPQNNSIGNWKLGDNYWNFSSFTGSGAVDSMSARKQGWPVQCRLKTVSSSLGDPSKRKWVTNLRTTHALKKKSFYKPEALYSQMPTNYAQVYVPEISIEVTSNNNNGMKVDKLKSRYSANLAARGDYYQSKDQYAQSALSSFNQNGLINFDFRFPAKSLRAIYKQIELASGKITAYKSDTSGIGVWKAISSRYALWVSGVPFGNISTQDYLVGMTVVTSFDGYQKEFIIEANSEDTLVLAGDFTSNIPAPDAQVEWSIKGVPRDQVWVLSGFDVTYTDYAANEVEYSKDQGNSNE